MSNQAAGLNRKVYIVCPETPQQCKNSGRSSIKVLMFNLDNEADLLVDSMDVNVIAALVKCITH